MEQGGRSSGESDRNQQQRRMKMPENISQPQPQPPPQKCPRCDSNNTKFCYYNNYSLTQPRYFCKTCRRYWTQGGTLRNVPVGGGCRKGKRTMKAVGSSSSAGESSSRSHHYQQRLPQIENLSAAAADFFSGNNCSRSQPPPLPSMSSLYTGGGGIGGGGVGGGGFLSSLAAIQSMTQSSQGINNQSQLGLISGSSNNQLFGNFNIPNTPPKVQINQQMESGFYQMVNREKPPMESSFHPTDETFQFQPTRPLGTWTQRFINNNYNSNTWPNNSVSSSNSGGANSSTAAAGASLSPNHWPDIPGFGPSP